MLQIPQDDPILRMWQTLLDLSGKRPEGWTLIGAQMVALHGLEHDRQPPRPSTDADIVVNARIVGQTVRDFALLLEDEGFELEGINTDGIGHRFKSGDVSIDLLAPDGLKPGTESLTTISPARTVQVPGGTQALRRTELVDVQGGKMVGRLPRPDLLGAILLKARAVDVDDVPSAQLLDLAFLLSLVGDPLAMRGAISSSERSWLRRRKELQDPAAETWRSLAVDDADEGRAVYRILTET